MALLKIARMGHPVLRNTASVVEDPTAPWVGRLVEDMIETMEDAGWEGCLSVPGLRGVVPRHLRVRYRGIGLDGEIIEREVEGFHARVVQHECDHLDGILYPQRMTDHRLLVFLEELQRHPIDLAEFLAEGRTA